MSRLTDRRKEIPLPCADNADYWRRVHCKLAEIEDSEERGELVRVVRCKDCMHKGWIQEPCHGRSIDYCHILEHAVAENFWCADGERREVDDG